MADKDDDSTARSFYGKTTPGGQGKGTPNFEQSGNEPELRPAQAVDLDAVSAGWYKDSTPKTQVDPRPVRAGPRRNIR